MAIRDLAYPDDARKVLDSLAKGLEYDAAISVAGIALGAIQTFPNTHDAVPFRYGDAQGAVHHAAPGLLARFSLVQMVGRFERHMALLLLQKRVLEHLGPTKKRMSGPEMWQILKKVRIEARQGPVKMCSEYLVKNPSPELRQKMRWMQGLYKVRNCLAHRLGQVEMEDTKPEGKGLDETNDTDVLRAIWLKPVVLLNGHVIQLPHNSPSGGNLEVTFAEQEREWKIGDQIEVSAEECQGIALSLATLAQQVLAEFEVEMNRLLAGG